MPTSYARATADAARTLEDAGFTSDEARLEAGILARGLLAWDRATWIAHLGEEAPHSFLDRFRGATDRRARREPMAYLVGSREFFGRRFGVTNSVLIPRPETELVVVEAIACLRRLPADRARVPSVIDVGTGSGCLAITIALEHPGARVTATDISAAALAVARQNASDLGARGLVVFQHTALAGGVGEAADLIVSNPPYVAEIDRASLPADVRDHEPATALFGGADGLDVIRALVPDARRALRTGGSLVMEIGKGQAGAVRALVEASRLTWRGAQPDLAGIPRVVLAEKL